MATLHLTQKRVDSFKPRKLILDVRDTELKGFGIRIMPSGTRRYFIHSQHEGRRLWKTFDDAGAVTVAQARQRARAMLAAYRNGCSADSGIGKDALFEAIAKEVLVHYQRTRTFRDVLERLSIPGVPWRVLTREGRLPCQVPALFVHGRRGGVRPGRASFVSCEIAGWWR